MVVIMMEKKAEIFISKFLNTSININDYTIW